MSNRFETISPWIVMVLETIKKEIKCEHLPRNQSFIQTHLGHRPLQRLKIEDILSAYAKELLLGNESLSEWVTNRWVFRHSDIYSHFAERLSAIHPDYMALTSLTEQESLQVLEGAVERFGALPVYLFSVLNCVVFPDAVFMKLRNLAEEAELDRDRKNKEIEKQETLEQEVASYKREVARVNEKYECKVAGMVKKYQTDIDALKNQIRALQKQIERCS